MFGKIIGTGKYVPHKRVTNFDLSEHVETDHEWIVERTGIECRHMMETEATSDMASLGSLRTLSVKAETAGFFCEFFPVSLRIEITALRLHLHQMTILRLLLHQPLMG